MKVTFPAQLIKVASRADRTYVLSFNTRELRGEHAASLLDELLNEGWLVWSSSDDITEADIPPEKADSMTGQKTQAQRLRAVIYRLFEQSGKSGNFEQYYQSVTESLIDQLKSKLE